MNSTVIKSSHCPGYFFLICLKNIKSKSKWQLSEHKLNIQFVNTCSYKLYVQLFSFSLFGRFFCFIPSCRTITLISFFFCDHGLQVTNIPKKVIRSRSYLISCLYIYIKKVLLLLFDFKCLIWWQTSSQYDFEILLSLNWI